MGLASAPVGPFCHTHNSWEDLIDRNDRIDYESGTDTRNRDNGRPPTSVFSIQGAPTLSLRVHLQARIMKCEENVIEITSVKLRNESDTQCAATHCDKIILHLRFLLLYKN